MECPRCTLPLKKVDLGTRRGGTPSVLVDLCPECQGGWFDKGELDVSDEKVWTDAEVMALRTGQATYSPLSCPRCYIPLSSITSKARPGLVLDRCPICSGFWLDEGERDAVRVLAADLGSAKMAGKAHRQRPPGWSWLRWVLYRARHPDPRSEPGPHS